VILVFCSTKGGVGKSNLAYHVATAILNDFRLLEIDDNNQTSLIFNDSEVLKKRVISVDTKSGEDAFSDALFAITQNSDVDVIIDAGGGNDSKKVIEMVAS
jgi:cellulose biosynthesis protein BcsQ